MKFFPKINVEYWALIISANTLGETVGDLLSQTFNIGYGGSTIILGMMYVIAISISIILNNNKPILYWVIIALSSTVGTTFSDFITRTICHDYLSLTQSQGYLIGVLFLALMLTIIFFSIKSLQIFDKLERGISAKNEFLYWLAILISSTLGTAFGDLLASNTPLGFDGSTLLLLGALGILIGLVYFTNISAVILYWLGIVLTHPIGATAGDYMTKSEGMDLGNVNASIILVIIFPFIVVLGHYFSKVFDLAEKPVR